jgi:beta-galactosidase
VVVATHVLKTAGRPARVRLTAEHAQVWNVWDDVVYVEAAVVDSAGVVVPNASQLITFQVKGPGRVVAVESGDNASHEPFQASERRAYLGRCFALVKSDAPRGRITLTAAAPGLAAGSVNVEATGPATFRVAGRRR